MNSIAIRQIGSILVILALLLPTPALATDFFPTRNTVRGFYSPVFDPTAQKILYIEREVTAWDWGPGWEFFTAPAWVRVSHDRYRLMEYDRQSGTTITLRTMPESPLAGKTNRHYRGRLYGLPRVMLRYESETGNLEYEIVVSLMTHPSTTSFRLYRWWNNATREVEEPITWQVDSGRMQGLNEDRLRGEVELFAVPGREGIPCAVAAWDHAGDRVDIVAQSRDFDTLYPGGVPDELLARDSQKERIEYLRTMRSDYERFYRRHLAEGIRDNDARLAANRDMQEAGYYPKTPTLTARLLEGSGGDAPLPLFEISRTEMESGIFNEIAAAIAAPGEPVDYGGPRYLTYTGYDTSKKLNNYLASGGNRYRIRYEGKVYQLVIDRPK